MAARLSIGRPEAGKIIKDKSSESWEAGKLCRESGRYNSAANRFYYSLFQAARFWCHQNKHLDCRKYVQYPHDRVRELVSSKAKSHGRELRDILMNLGELRNKADYKPIQIIDSDIAEAVKNASAAKAFFLKT